MNEVMPDPGSLLNITVALCDGSRSAQVMLPRECPVAELMEQCTLRWSLPDATFIFRLMGSDELLAESETLAAAGVSDRSELVIYPILEGG